MRRDAARGPTFAACPPAAGPVAQPPGPDRARDFAAGSHILTFN